jgi:hypothetical protein
MHVPLICAANSARNLDGQIGAEMNYFMAWKKQVVGWQERVSGARA